MERLNALDWADGLCFTAYGLRFGIRATRSEFLPEIAGELPPQWRPSGTRKVQWLYSLSSVPSRRRPGTLLHQLYTGGELLTRGSDFKRVRRAFGLDLRGHLATLSPWRHFIHAGAVGWRGKAILLPGNSGAGKTRMTAALVRAGATLLSDEFAVLDRKGRVHPYPLPLRMKDSSGGVATEVTLEELGGREQKGPLPVGLVLSTRFVPGAGSSFRKMSPGRTALALVSHAIQARLRPERVLEATGHAASGALGLQGPRGEAEDTVDTLLGLW